MRRSVPSWAKGGIAEGTQRREQRGEEDVNPLIGFALAHTEQALVHHLEGISLEGGGNKREE